jgi:hypothetical protein
MFILEPASFLTSFPFKIFKLALTVFQDPQKLSKKPYLELQRKGGDAVETVESQVLLGLWGWCISTGWSFFTPSFSWIHSPKRASEKQ